MFKKIKDDLNRRMEQYTDSRHPTDDEVSIAWLITEVEKLQKTAPKQLKIKKVAENILKDLYNLDHRTKTVQKIAYSYRDKQLEIILNHLRELTNS